jgi:DNA-binding PadR family transcriptional regulator
VQRLQQMSREALQVRQGSLYPALYRMERRGLIAPEWRTHDSGRDAKYYKITKAGQAALAKQTEEWRNLRGVIDLILGEKGVEEGA